MSDAEGDDHDHDAEGLAASYRQAVAVIDDYRHGRPRRSGNGWQECLIESLGMIAKTLSDEQTTAAAQQRLDELAKEFGWTPQDRALVANRGWLR